VHANIIHRPQTLTSRKYSPNHIQYSTSAAALKRATSQPHTLTAPLPSAHLPLQALHSVAMFTRELPEFQRHPHYTSKNYGIWLKKIKFGCKRTVVITSLIIPKNTKHLSPKLFTNLMAYKPVLLSKIIFFKIAFSFIVVLLINL